MNNSRAAVVSTLMLERVGMDGVTGQPRSLRCTQVAEELSPSSSAIRHLQRDLTVMEEGHFKRQERQIPV
jgi:hypothetical protein